MNFCLNKKKLVRAEKMVRAPTRTMSVIISPKFEISGILWFWFGRRRRTPRLVFHVTATPMRVSKFICDTAIDDLEQKNPYRFWRKSENQNGRQRPFCENMMKQACALHNLIKNAPINFIFDVATDILIEVGAFQFWQKSGSKMAAGGHFEKKKKVAYSSEMARNVIQSDFQSSKMAAGGHFVKKNKKTKVAY